MLCLVVVVRGNLRDTHVCVPSQSNIFGNLDAEALQTDNQDVGFGDFGLRLIPKGVDLPVEQSFLDHDRTHHMYEEMQCARRQQNG